MVHAMDGQSWRTACRTGRGIGRPIRPPTVWTKRTDFGPTSGSACMSGRCTAGKRTAASLSLTVVEADVPPPRYLSSMMRPSPSTSVKARSRSPPGSVLAAQRFEVGDLVRRRLVVMGDAELEGNIGGPLDRLGRDPRDGSYRRFDPHCRILWAASSGR